MILRRSKTADLPALQALWQSVFGDPPAFTGRFYETFGADSAIVAQQEGEIIAMIHPLPVALAQNGRYSFGVYIYALATAPAHRGQGIAARLLEAAESNPFPVPPTLGTTADASGLVENITDAPAFSLLIPGEESLFAYYRGKGYTREAAVLSREAEDYPSQLRQGMKNAPIFLKPEAFYTFSRKIPEAVPPPVEQALWKPLSQSLTDSKPTLSHFMQ